ncbi:MAG: (Fe-S)-binding protein [Chloroflexota bacterium]
MAIAVETDANIFRLGNFVGPDIPEDELLHACVHCGMCLSSCPTYRITGKEMSSPRGRLWLMLAVAEERLSLDDPLFDEQMYQCLNCRACEAVCPSGVQYGPLIEASRATLEYHRQRTMPQNTVRKVAMDWLFADAPRMRGAVSLLRFYQRSGAQTLARKSGIIGALGMAEMEDLMPPAAKKSLIPGDEYWEADEVPGDRRTAHLFNGCMMGTVFANSNRAAARVMAHNGSNVDVPVRQQCCGALAVHAGMMDEARVLARKNIEAFEASGEGAIIVTAAGCGAALKEYGHLLKDDPEYAARAKDFSDRVKDFTEYVAATPIVEPPIEISRTVTYQEPCHLAHAQRITAQPRKLLRSVKGLRLEEMKESSLCCGSAGIYNILRPEMANTLGDRKAHHVMETDAVEVVTANPGCAIQLRASLERNGGSATVRHIADVLDEAYGGVASKRAIIGRAARARHRTSGSADARH